MLKIAIQKSDRISEGFLDLLSKCNFEVDKNHSKLYCKLNDLPIELYFIRGSDISSLLEEKFDVAILGKNSFLEYQLDKITSIKRELKFAKCRISFAGKAINNIDLNNKIIATSYVNILQRYLDNNKINAKIIKMNGSVETAIELNIADIIFDIVQTGSTLLEHGLIEYFKVLDSEATMIVKNNFQSDVLDKLLFRIDAILNGKPSKYIMFNLKKSLLDDLLKILPAGKSPTILNLIDPNYCAIHTLCNEDEIWNISENLQKNGAEDILISNIDLRFL